MKIFSLFENQNKFENIVFNSINALSNSTEWQNVLNDYFTIIDARGNICKWDQSKKEGFSTTYNFIHKIVKKRLRIR